MGDSRWPASVRQYVVEGIPWKAYGAEAGHEGTQYGNVIALIGS